ncbi:MAG: pyrroline-5-carboxylate reductase [Pseudomonadota bacterium]
MTDITDLNTRGLLLVGCGKMGGAMLAGWLRAGLTPGAAHVRDPAAQVPAGVQLNGTLPSTPALTVIAVKPLMMDAALADLVPLAGADTIVLSIAAGTPIARFEATFGPATPIIRAMPNTPAAIGQGITAMIGNAAAGSAALDLAEAALAATGAVVRLAEEAQMDAVTGVSGSGPAYVFHMIECLAAAGEAEGLAPELALHLARATIAGAGALAMADATPPEILRRNVTSPNGTTQAGLEVLMAAETGLGPLMRRTVAAAAARSRALAG